MAELLDPLEINISVSDIALSVSSYNWYNLVLKLVRQLKEGDRLKVINIPISEEAETILRHIRSLTINTVEELYEVQSKYQKEILEILTVGGFNEYTKEHFIDRINRASAMVYGTCAESSRHQYIKDDLSCDLHFDCQKKTRFYQFNDGIVIHVTGLPDGITPDTIVEIKHHQSLYDKQKMNNNHKVQTYGYMWLYKMEKALIYEFYKDKTLKWEVTNSTYDFLDILKVIHGLILCAIDLSKNDGKFKKLQYSKEKLAILKGKIQYYEKEGMLTREY